MAEMMMERGEILTADQEEPMFELRWDHDPRAVSFQLTSNPCFRPRYTLLP